MRWKSLQTVNSFSIMYGIRWLQLISETQFCRSAVVLDSVVPKDTIPLPPAMNFGGMEYLLPLLPTPPDGPGFNLLTIQCERRRKSVSLLYRSWHPHHSSNPPIEIKFLPLPPVMSIKFSGDFILIVTSSNYLLHRTTNKPL